MSYNLTYKEYFSRYYNNNSGYLKKSQVEEVPHPREFHINCPYMRRKKCFCNLYTLSSHAKSLNDFIQKLSNGDIDIDISGKKIKVTDISSKKVNHPDKKILNERIKETDYHQMKEFSKHINETYLNVSDYKDIEKTINEDKKVCEKCGINSYGDNYHRGWKNDNGDYILLCYSCSKKYFAGANEVKYETKREEYSSSVNMNRGYPTHYGTSSTVIPPFKTDINAHRNINFHVINTAGEQK